MSETPEEERPAAAAQNQPAPAAGPPVYQTRGFQLAAVGVVGLLLGGAIGLGIGLTAGFAFSHHDRPAVGHHQQWGPGDGYRGPDRKRVPVQPFVPPRRQPPTPVSPSPQAS